MGPKSVGFDEKCTTYMAKRAEFVPGLVDPAEVLKDRTLRTQLLRFAAELETLIGSVDDTLQLVSSEAWMADLAYYQSVREAAHRGGAGAQDIYDDLRARFPWPRGVRGAGARDGLIRNPRAEWWETSPPKFFSSASTLFGSTPTSATSTSRLWTSSPIFASPAPRLITSPPMSGTSTAGLSTSPSMFDASAASLPTSWPISGTSATGLHQPGAQR